MSLVKSLTNNLSKGLVSNLNGRALSPADASLIANYPLSSSLTDNVGGKTGTLLRASGKNIPNQFNKYLHFNDNLAAFTGKAVNLEGTGTNKCTNYSFSTSLVGVTDGATVSTTLVTDEDELRVAGFGDFIDSGKLPSGGVFKSENTDEAMERNVTISGNVGSTDAHSFSIVARIDSGTSAKIGLVGQAASEVSFSNSGYNRVSNDNVIPDNASKEIQLTIMPSTTVYWFANQLESGETVTSLMETQGAAGNRDLDNLKLELGVPVNDFSIYGNIKGWSQVGTMVSQAVLQNKESSSNQWLLRNSATGSQTIGFYQTIGGSIQNVFANTGGEDFDFLIKKSSTDGVTLITDFDSDNNPTMTGDIALPQLLTQVGNSDSLAQPSNFVLSNLKAFNGTDMTLEEARTAGNP